jgi:hypothetical protein
MTQINLKRVGLGGITAAIIIFILTGVLNGALLQGEFQNWSSSMEGHLSPPAMPVQMLLWALMALIQGISLVWLYAGIRPRFGTGPKTALIASSLLWLSSKLATGIDLFALGLFTPRFLVGQVLGGFVIFLFGGLAGAFVYKEKAL